MAESGDGLENVVGGFCPAERSRGRVVVGDEGGDRILQLLDAAVAAAADLSPVPESSPASHLVEPWGNRRG